MPESMDQQLEQKRFVINPESMAGMKRLRSTFAELKEEYPWLSGLGFFGSRTKGIGHDESDLDVCIFFNSDKMDTAWYFGDWATIAGKLQEGLGIKLDKKLKHPMQGQYVDISTRSTEEQIKSFIKGVDENWFAPIGNLFFRFFLTVGDEVYLNREYVLDHFESIPEGNKYFRVLMKDMSRFERGNSADKPSTPNYKRYPKNIKQARKYFITKSVDGVSEDQTSLQSEEILSEIGIKS